MSKSKKNARALEYVLAALQIVMMVVIICSLAMTAYSVTGTVAFLGSSTSYCSITEFIGDIFNGDTTSAWAIIAMICYFITLLVALSSIVLEVLKMFGVSMKKSPSKIIGILLTVFAAAFMITMIIFISVSMKDQSIVVGGTTLANASGAISVAPILTPILAIISLVLNMFRK